MTTRILICLDAGERVAAKQANRMMAADMGSSKVSYTCQVPGFKLKPKQLPKSACANTGCAGAVLLRTLQGPNPTDKTAASFNLAEAASQCKANPVCVMFTSDGFSLRPTGCLIMPRKVMKRFPRSGSSRVP
jgi:hypothetical protein